MLRTLFVGALAAFVGSKLIKANEEGRLDSLKTRLRDGADQMRDRLREPRDGVDGNSPELVPARALPAPPAASRRARKSADPTEVSKPAKAHPWPADPAAMPEEA
jgi:hypothetical protein